MSTQTQSKSDQIIAELADEIAYRQDERARMVLTIILTLKLDRLNMATPSELLERVAPKNFELYAEVVGNMLTAGLISRSASDDGRFVEFVLTA